MGKPPEATKLFQRLGMVVDPQIEAWKRSLGPYANGAGLAAPLVASCAFAGFHCDDEALVKTQGGGRDIGIQGFIDDLLPRQHISRDGDLWAFDVPAPADTRRTRIGGHPAFAVDQMDLSVVAASVQKKQGSHDVTRG